MRQLYCKNSKPKARGPEPRANLTRGRLPGRRLLNKQEAARYTGFSVSTFERLCDARPIAFGDGNPRLNRSGDIGQVACVPPDYEGLPGTVLCVSSRGEPWTGSGFRASFFKLIRKLAKDGKVGKGLSFHGLRSTVATELREAGVDLRTIADLLGQNTAQMAM